MEKHILFLDLDGTLLNDRGQITPGNRNALQQALERGHSVVIATGRPLPSAMEQASALGLDSPGCCLAAYNGAVVYDWTEGKLLLHRTLPMQTVYRIFDYANGQGIHVQTYDRSSVLVEPACADAALETYCSRTGMPHRVMENVRQDLMEAPVKVLLIDFQDPARLEAAARWVREAPDIAADCFYSCREYLEIVPAGAGKGAAVQLLCRLKDVPLSRAVAVGDGANDLSMLRVAGTGVAMANAAPEVKRAADFITRADNNHDAIAEVVQRFLC